MKQPIVRFEVDVEELHMDGSARWAVHVFVTCTGGVRRALDPSLCTSKLAAAALVSEYVVSLARGDL